MARLRHRGPNGHDSADRFDDLQEWRELGGPAGPDTGTEEWRWPVPRTPSPVTLAALEAFIAGHCEPCRSRSRPPATGPELREAAVEAGVTGIADLTLVEFVCALAELGHSMCCGPGEPPPCMFWTGRGLPPCDRVGALGDGISSRHPLMFASCRGLALRSPVAQT